MDKRAPKLDYCLSLNADFTPVFGADFWEGDATKHLAVKKKVFSVKRGEAFSE